MDKRIIAGLLALAVGVAVGLLYGPSVPFKPPADTLKAALSETEIAAVPLSPAEEELAKTIGVDRKVVQLAKAYGEGIKQFEGYDEEGYSKAFDGVSLDVPQEDVLGTLDALRPQLAPLGCQVYRYEMNFGFNGPDRLVIIKTNDKFEILRLMQTNGANYTIDNAKVIERLKDWDGRFGLELLSAGMDLVEARFVTPPPDMLAFAREVYEFCPDVVDQGAGSIEELAKEMKRENAVYLWWD